MTQELVASGTVLESAEHGPELCLGVLLLSYPPQGGGPPITNWDWSRVSGQESHGGTTWGQYTVIGTYTDGAFTMTRPPTPVQTLGDVPEPEWDADLLDTPCAPPTGGWRVIEPERTTDESLERAIEVAESLPGFADVWVDEIAAPRAGDVPDEEEEMNDPANFILNVAVTGNPGAAEARLRQTWGGALCVSRARHTARELQRIQHDLHDQQGMLILSVGRDHVDLDVVHDDGSLQRELDDRFSSGLVRVTSALQPYDPG